MMRHLLPAAALIAVMLPPIAHGEIPDHKIKIGILQDMPDPEASETGRGGVTAAQLAAADFEKAYLKGDAEILAETSQGGVEDDVDKTRDLLDNEHVAAIVSSAGSLVNQRIADLVKQRHRTLLVTDDTEGSTQKLCSPSVIIWSAGARARIRALAQVFASQKKTRWYITTEENPSGVAAHAALQDAVSLVGGQIVGQDQHPVGSLNFPTLMPDIDKTNAEIVLLGETDGDLIAALRSLSLSQPQHPVSFAAPYAQVADIDATGVAAASGLVLVAPFYWDSNEQSRDFAKRWGDRMQGETVTDNAATVYSATLSFLHAAKAVDDIDADKVIPQLRRAPLKDPLFGTATIRNDGRVVYDLGVYRVKPPDSVQERWAYLRKIATVPGSQAFSSDACPAAQDKANVMQRTP